MTFEKPRGKLVSIVVVVVVAVVSSSSANGFSSVEFDYRKEMRNTPLTHSDAGENKNPKLPVLRNIEELNEQLTK